MCGPVDIGGAVSSAATAAKEFVSTASTAELLSAAGTAVGAGAQLHAGQQAKKALEKQAEILKKSGQFETARLREDADRLKARQKVAAAKSGVKGGSVLEVMRQTAQDVEEEALNIKFGAEAGAQARLFEAKQAATASGIGAINTILSGFGR